MPAPPQLSVPILRLSEIERVQIVSTIREWDKNAKVYLYGSRTRDDLKGGDIDLMIISDQIGFSDKIDILIALKSKIGDQKIDLKVLPKSSYADDPFWQHIRSTNPIELTH